MKLNPTIRLLLALNVVGVATSHAAKSGTKYYSPAKEENDINRNRVKIKNTVLTKKKPALMNPEDTSFDRARRFTLDQKTAELISQLETLIKRPGQKSRYGELKMRLAELYYDRGQLQAARESEVWEGQVKQWEALSESERAKTARPVLKTPRADSYRRKSLQIYQDLEAMSRSTDNGRNQMIRRDEVLFFLASTYRDLGEIKKAEPYYRELSDRYPKSSRVFSARLNLADLYFDSGQNEKAIPLYLSVAAGEGAPNDDNTDHIKGYALYKLGWAYMNSATYDRSIMAFKRAIEAADNSKNNDRKIVLKREAMYDLARAYALSGNLDEAESYFVQAGGDGSEALDRFREEAAATARDQGKSGAAIKYYDKLIAANPKSAQARDYAMEKVKLMERSNDAVAYQKALDDFANRYGEGSEWLRSQPPEGRTAPVEELVALLRREAKNNHNVAQKKDQPALFRSAAGFYAVYFRHVPTPNADSRENLHELRFFYAELLFKLGDYATAAKFYEQTGPGKYGPAAAYARILSLQKLSAGKGKNDATVSAEIVRATQDFATQYPQDDRVGDMLYTSAQEAFKSGDSKESVETLKKVVDRFPGDKKGVEAAERILFVLEKDKNYDQLVFESSQMMQNQKLMKTGGADFKTHLQEYQQKAAFKRAEALQDPTAKGRAFMQLAAASSGDTKEKALNNAMVYSRQGSDRATELSAQQDLVKSFPKSAYAKDVYFRMGELSARQGKWLEAKKNYENYIRNYSTGKADGKDIEAAKWNWIFIEAQIEEVWYPAFSPRKVPTVQLVTALEEFIKSYPKSPNQGKAIEILAFRKGVSVAQVGALDRAPGLAAADRKTLAEAKTVAQVRAGQNYSGVVSANPPNPNRSEIMKQAVALAAFELEETKFNGYNRQPLNTTPAKFAKSFKGKLDALEGLERDYLRVVSYGNGDAALKSLERLSRLYRGLGNDLKKVSTEKADLSTFFDPLFKKSDSFLKTCFEKASELKIGGPGLRACQVTAAESDADFANIGQERFPDPKWLPVLTGDEGALPLVQAAMDSFKKGRFGEASLALTILNERKDIEVSDSQRHVLENLEGLSLYRNGFNEAAVRSFRKASESTSSSVKAAALKNLAAVYLNVADFDQALDAIAPIAATANDADTALILGVGHKGVGEIAEALDAYEKGLQLAPNDATLNYNRSFALAASDLYLEAAKAIQRYIELTSPPSNDVSRLLYRRWKGKASNEKMSDEI